jgi:anaerobic selenocysteine-containing dehydrogenase
MTTIPRREFFKLSGAIGAGLATWPRAASPVAAAAVRAKKQDA